MAFRQSLSYLGLQSQITVGLHSWIWVYVCTNTHMCQRVQTQKHTHTTHINPHAHTFTHMHAQGTLTPDSLMEEHSLTLKLAVVVGSPLRGTTLQSFTSVIVVSLCE